MNLKNLSKKLFALMAILLATQLNLSAIEFHSTLDSLGGRKFALVQPWLKDQNIRTLQDGAIMHASTLLLTDRRDYDYALNQSIIHPDIYYAVIEYPGEGVYYGLIRVRPSKGFDHGCNLLGGRFITTDGRNLFVHGQTPAHWEKQSRKKPSGTYKFRTYKDGFGSKSGKKDLVMTYVFNPAGTFTASFGKQFTEYAPQEIAGEMTTTKRTAHGKRTKRTTQLTGGWYYDIDAKATCSGKWTLKNDTLKLKFTGKPRYTATSKFNRQAQIDQWKREDAVKFIEYELDTYRRQYLAQAQADYPNYKVKETKEAVIDLLKQNFANFEELDYVVYYLTDNNLEICSTQSNTKIQTFQKEPDWKTWFDNDDFDAGYDAFYSKWNEIAKWIVKTRNKKIEEALLKENGLGAHGDMLVAQLAEDGESALLLTFQKEGDRLMPFWYVLDLSGGNVKVKYETRKMESSLDTLIAEMQTNEEKLQSNAINKNEKELKKKAKKYLKLTKNNPIDINYYSLLSYRSVYKAVRDRIKLQNEYL